MPAPRETQWWKSGEGAAGWDRIRKIHRLSVIRDSLWAGFWPSREPLAASRFPSQENLAPMNADTQTMEAPHASVAERTLFGHPRGLMTLFFTELWERFSYYGMRAILMLFMTAAAAEGGLGWGTDQAGSVYALYTSLVYLVSLPGGWLADKFLGQRKAVLWGGAIIMLGHIALAMHGMVFFFSGLLLIVIGTGLLKPNISAMVGQLYAPGDARRDAGFSIFYMGINIGAFLSPLVCGWLAQHQDFRDMLEGWGMNAQNSWHWGFGAAAVGMFFGLVQYVLGGRNLGTAGLHPAQLDPESYAKAKRLLTIGLVSTLVVVGGLAAIHMGGIYELSEQRINNGFSVLVAAVVIGFFWWLFKAGDWKPEERKRLFVIMVLFFGASVFWSCFEQAGSTLNLFAEESTHCTAFGYEFPSSWFQSLNAIFIIALAPVFAWLWVALKDRSPGSPAKFAFGLFFVGLGFAVLMGGARLAGDTGRVSPWWLFMTYLLHTIGELCLSPVGLSAMTKLAPARVVGMMMGVWFLATSVGNLIAGNVARLYGEVDRTDIFLYVTIFAMAATVVMLFTIRPIRNMLGGKEELEASG